jgi:hypothetical protein
MGLISNGTTIFDAGALDSGIAKGAMTFIKKLTASSSATLSFVHGASGVVLDGTYKEYVFVCTNLHPQTDSREFQVNFRDGSTAYDATKTTTYFRAYHDEADSATTLSYDSNNDEGNSTDPQYLSSSVGADADQSTSGILHLFDPSNTTFVKHFISTFNHNTADDYSQVIHVGGYCNVTAAIDGVQFTFRTGNIDAGDICLYGIT